MEFSKNHNVKFINIVSRDDHFLVNQGLVLSICVHTYEASIVKQKYPKAVSEILIHSHSTYFNNPKVNKSKNQYDLK